MEPVLWIDFFKGIILLGPIYLLNLFTALFSLLLLRCVFPLLLHQLPFGWQCIDFRCITFCHLFVSLFFVLHVVKSISFSDWYVLFAAFVVLSYQNFWCMCLSRMVYLIFYYGRFGDKGVYVCVGSRSKKSFSIRKWTRISVSLVINCCVISLLNLGQLLSSSCCHLIIIMIQLK